MGPIIELLSLASSAFIRLVAGPLDRRRIIKCFEKRGFRVCQIQWSPFSRGWLCFWDHRFYRVNYHAGAGALRTARCRTSWYTGVVVTADEDSCNRHAGRLD